MRIWDKRIGRTLAIPIQPSSGGRITITGLSARRATSKVVLPTRTHRHHTALRGSGDVGLATVIESPGEHSAVGL